MYEKLFIDEMYENCLLILIIRLFLLKVPFRESHHLVGKVVALAESHGVSISELTVPQLKTIRYN